MDAIDILMIVLVFAGTVSLILSSLFHYKAIKNLEKESDPAIVHNHIHVNCKENPFSSVKIVNSQEDEDGNEVQQDPKNDYKEAYNHRQGL